MCIRDRYQRRVHGVFNTRSDSNAGKEKTPGPGAYNTCESFAAPSARMVTASRNNTWDRYRTPGPGPAAYSCETQKSARGVKFNRAKRDPTFDLAEAPGPGSYPVKSLIGTGAKRALIVSRRKDATPNTEGCSPGPGAYQIVDKEFRRGIKIGTSKRKFSYTKNTPSPFQYTPKYEAKKHADPVWRYSSHNQ
eukprot:TRINITY_DN5581_c0_g1_i5.p2 TRINITY_DN5581_c0_g1~~TRINITY_DN5581_c0_g1_i5.p2  ORF type:complete len:192 (+),score=32.91 TRINITY_DN5581_c0_g1_i5:77-652(+)